MSELNAATSVVPGGRLSRWLRLGWLWRGGYRGELLVLCLVAVAALAVVSAHTPQDVTRIALTRAIVEDGSVRMDPYAAQAFDLARRGGHFYTDKAPGWSVAAIPAFAVLHALGAAPAADPASWNGEGDLRVWALRVLVSGLCFLLAVIAVGRVAERIAPGTAAAVATLFGLGTLAQPLAASGFGHMTAGAAAFISGWAGFAESCARAARGTAAPRAIRAGARRFHGWRIDGMQAPGSGDETNRIEPNSGME